MTLLKATDSPLLRLPIELISATTVYLCSHCSDCDEKESRASLLSLSSTCSKLRQIAQPILYHDVTVFQSHYHFNEASDAKCFAKLIMLATTPRLAAGVRKLRTYHCTLDTKERRSKILPIAQALSFDVPPDFLATAPDPPVRASAGQAYFDILVETLICQLPNIQSLDMVMDTHDHYDPTSCATPLQHLARRFEARKPSPGLPKLQSATFNAHDEDMSFNLRCSGIRAIIGAAPTLQTLQFHGVDDTGLTMQLFEPYASTLVKVRNLQFWDADFPDASTVCKFVNLMPRLVSLSCHTMRTAPLDIGALLSDLGPASKTIQHFSFERKHGPYQDAWAVTKQDLECLPNLRTLRIGQALFCQHEDDVDPEHCDTDQDDYSTCCLLDILPRTLHTLVIIIDYDHDCCNCAPDIKQLATAINAGKYPNLARVQIDISDQCCQPTPSRRVSHSTVSAEVPPMRDWGNALQQLLQTRVTVWARNVNTWFPNEWHIGGSYIVT